jgi:hypothetical protein
MQNSGWALSGLHPAIQERLLRFSNEERGIWLRFMREWLLFIEYYGSSISSPVKYGLLDAPVLYLSRYINQNKNKYYRLFRIGTFGRGSHLERFTVRP